MPLSSSASQRVSLIKNTIWPFSTVSIWEHTHGRFVFDLAALVQIVLITQEPLINKRRAPIIFLFALSSFAFSWLSITLSSIKRSLYSQHRRSFCSFSHSLLHTQPLNTCDVWEKDLISDFSYCKANCLFWDFTSRKTFFFFFFLLDNHGRPCEDNLQSSLSFQTPITHKSENHYAN